MRRYEDGAGAGSEGESMGDRMKHQAEDAGEQARQRASDAAEDARAKANEMYEQAQAYVNDLAEEQTGRLTGSIGSIAAAIRAASSKLGEDQMQPADAWVDSLADQVESCKHYIDEQKALDMLGEVRHYAQRYPYVLVGAAFVTGIGIARFIKASGKRHGRPNSGADETGAQESGGYAAGAYPTGDTEPYYGSPGQAESEFRAAAAGPSTTRQSPATPPRPATGQAPPQELQTEPRPTEQE